MQSFGQRRHLPDAGEDVFRLLMQSLGGGGGHEPAAYAFKQRMACDGLNLGEQAAGRRLGDAEHGPGTGH